MKVTSSNAIYGWYDTMAWDGVHCIVTLFAVMFVQDVCACVHVLSVVMYVVYVVHVVCAL